MKRILKTILFSILFYSLSSGCTSIVLIDPLDEDSNDPAIEELESLSSEISATIVTADSTFKVKEVEISQGKFTFKMDNNDKVDSIDINQVQQIEFLDRVQGANEAALYAGGVIFVTSAAAVYGDPLGKNFFLPLAVGAGSAIISSPIPMAIGAIKGKKIIYINRSNQSDSPTTKSNNILKNNALGLNEPGHR